MNIILLLVLLKLTESYSFQLRSYLSDSGSSGSGGFGTVFAIGSKYALIGTGRTGVMYSMSDTASRIMPSMTWNGSTARQDCFSPGMCEPEKMDISGSTIVVGQNFDCFRPNSTYLKMHGSVLIYDIVSPTSIKLVARLLPDLSLLSWNDTNAYQYNYGSSVSIDGDYVAVSSPFEPAPFENSVYIYRRKSYKLVKRLVNPFGRSFDRYEAVFKLMGNWLFADGVLVRWSDLSPGIVADFSGANGRFAVGGTREKPCFARSLDGRVTLHDEKLTTTVVGYVSSGRVRSIAVNAACDMIVVGMPESGAKYPSFMQDLYAGQVVRFVKSSTGWWQMPLFELEGESRGLGNRVALSSSGRMTLAATDGNQGRYVYTVLLPTEGRCAMK